MRTGNDLVLELKCAAFTGLVLCLAPIRAHAEDARFVPCGAEFPADFVLPFAQFAIGSPL